MKKLLIVLSVVAFGLGSVSCGKKCTCQEWINGEKEGKEYTEKLRMIGFVESCGDLGNYYVDSDGKKHGIQCK